MVTWKCYEDARPNKGSQYGRPPVTKIESVKAFAYEIPTESEESDGTLRWKSTTIILVRVEAGEKSGIGWSYTSAAATQLISGALRQVVVGRDPEETRRIWSEMVAALRNLGRPGLCSSAVAAVDNAVWDLKAKLHDQPLCRLLGPARTSVRVYGSGGFTSYDESTLKEQLERWADSGFYKVKMKVGREPKFDPKRVVWARKAIGDACGLMVDGNGAYDTREALALAHRFADEANVEWFEEPVSSDNLEGLRFLREHGPPAMEITAGEYGYRSFYFRRMLEAGAVDVLQSDVTRCAGVTEFLRVGALCLAHQTPLSAHTSPTLHMHLCTTIQQARDLEWFHDHVRIERKFFEGFVEPENGWLTPHTDRPGWGVECRWQDIETYRTA